MKKRNQKHAALVCVTNQYSCGRLIAAGEGLAAKQALELKVLCVQPTKYANNSYLNEIEYLFGASREAGAEMVVYYRDDPVRAALTYIRSHRIAHIVVGGVPDVTRSAFISAIRAQCAQIPVSIVDETGNLILLSSGQDKAIGI